MPASSRRTRASLVATLAVAGLVVGLVTPPSAAGPIPDPYYPLDGNVGYDVQHYDIRNTYRFDPVQLSGTTTITLVPDAELTELSLDFLLPVTAVTIDGVAADDFAPTDGAGHELSITPAAPLAAGEAVDVKVTYSGDPSAESYVGDTYWPSSDHEVVTIGEPHIATWWFPANDHPSDKATFDIRITTGRAKEVISNGRLVGREVDGTKATTHWRMAQPMTTYLAFFAAGDFKIEKGRARGHRFYNAVSRGLGDAATDRELRKLRKSAGITAWLEDELGDYPFSSTGGIVVDVGPGYALENQTRPIYSGGTVTWLIVHELAHQWFGDSVAVRRWKHIWLNEGFATYMEVRYAEAHGGKSTDAWLHRTYDGRKSSSTYWDIDISDPGAGFGNLFAHQVYERGGMTLAALRNVIGKPKFKALLQRWAASNRHGDATVPEFVALAEKMSDKDLGRFFYRWLKADRPPPDRTSFGL